MFTRAVQRKRPRRPAFLFLTAGAVASLLVASVALALVSDSGTYSVEVANKSLSSDFVQLTATPGDGSALVKYIGSSAQDQASGTGLFDPFVRIQGSLPTAPTESGYNTCSQQSCGGAVTEFETKPGTWTHPIKAAAIPIVNCEIDGDENTTERCWELFVDINEGNNAKYVSLTTVEIYFTDNANGVITDYPFTGEATLQYEFSGEIKIHDVNQGSGRGDLLYLVPVQTFDADDWFVLYSEWGSLDTAPDNKNYASEGGFEEWKVRKTPNVGIVKTADDETVNAGEDIGFTITVSNGGVADATNVVITDPLPTGFTWTIDPAVTGCSIGGTPVTLTCTFATLAAGASRSVHITASTSADDCGPVPNVASFTTGNDGSGSDDASVTILCGALQVTKTAKHADSESDPNLVATFTVVDADGNSHEITTDATGVGCANGVAIGMTTSITETGVPDGYSAPTIANVDVTAGACGEAGVANVNVENTPLTDVDIVIDSQHDGATSTLIECWGPGSDPATDPPDHSATVGDGSLPITDLDPTAPDITLNCQITIDP